MRLSIYNNTTNKNVGFTVTVVALFIAFLSLSYNGNAFSTTTLRTSNGFSSPVTNNNSNNNSLKGPRRRKDSSRQLLTLNMQKQGRNQEENQRQKISLSVSASELLDYDYNYDYDIIQKTSSTSSSIPEPSLLESFILPVASASLMITGNTVGAGMLALPAVVAGPGPILSFGVMIGAWMMCLMSGLTIAQVAIQEHESNGGDVPSSFKEFAEATLPPSAANTVSGTSVFINTLILAFNIFTAGQIGSSLLPAVLPFDSSFLPLVVDDTGTLLSYLFAGGLFCIISSQSLKNLSKVSSILVLGLFGTFAGLLRPGLSNISDPISVLTSSSLPKEELGDGMLLLIPVVVSILIFQNIVPTITRLLDYDRLKVQTALTCGSIIPPLMYMAWTIAVLGGGIDMASTSTYSSTLGGLMTCFSMITVMGSSLGVSMSLSEEFEIILDNDSSNSETTKTNTFSLPSVAIPVGISLVLSQIFASDITDTLKIAGSFGSPILYGLIPVSMVLMQRQKPNINVNNDSNDSNIIPGGVLGLGVLALGSTALVGTELFETIRNGTI